MAKIRVLIADHHPVFRLGLQALLSSQPDMEVVGEVGDLAETLALARETNPDVLALELAMPAKDSLSLLTTLHQECARIRVLVLTMHDDPALLGAALAAGSSGYVVKTAPAPELLAAVRAVSQGRTIVDLNLSGSAVHRALGASKPEGGAAGAGGVLSQREQQVLSLLAQGHTNQQVAKQLHVSVKTAETYRARLAEKLGLHGRAELYRYAVEAGLLTPGKAGPKEKAN